MTARPEIYKLSQPSYYDAKSEQLAKRHREVIDQKRRAHGEEADDYIFGGKPLPERATSREMGMAVADTLKQRHNIHGDYWEQSRISMLILRAMQLSANWKVLAPSKEEALILIAVKLGRILTGDPNAADHWHDIAGYAQLVENIINGKQANGLPEPVRAKAPTTREIVESITGAPNNEAHATAEGPTNPNWGKGQTIGEAKCQIETVDLPLTSSRFGVPFGRERLP